MIDVRDLIQSLREDQFRWLGLRQADLDKQCVCVTEGKDGIRTPSKSCTRCMATGFLFTDYLIKGYLWKSFFAGAEFPAAVGRISTQGRNVIVEYDRPIRKFDLILELDLDHETSEPRQPFTIMSTWSVVDSFQVICDGKTNFWRCTLQERSTDDYRPGHEGTNYKYEGN